MPRRLFKNGLEEKPSTVNKNNEKTDGKEIPYNDVAKDTNICSNIQKHKATGLNALHVTSSNEKNAALKGDEQQQPSSIVCDHRQLDHHLISTANDYQYNLENEGKKRKGSPLCGTIVPNQKKFKDIPDVADVLRAIKSGRKKRKSLILNETTPHNQNASKDTGNAVNTIENNNNKHLNLVYNSIGQSNGDSYGQQKRKIQRTCSDAGKTHKDTQTKKRHYGIQKGDSTIGTTKCENTFAFPNDSQQIQMTTEASSSGIVENHHGQNTSVNSHACNTSTTRHNKGCFDSRNTTSFESGTMNSIDDSCQMRNNSINDQTCNVTTTLDNQDVSHLYIDIGDCDYACEHCNARFWYSERLKKHEQSNRVKYNKCCADGKVQLPKELEPPTYVKQLLKDKHFLDNIRAYNQMFSMTSFGAEVDDSINDGRGSYVFKISGEIYHWIGTICPTNKDEPKFMQLYIYDTQNEVANRMKPFGGKEN